MQSSVFIIRNYINANYFVAIEKLINIVFILYFSTLYLVLGFMRFILINSCTFYLVIILIDDRHMRYAYMRYNMMT